MDDRSTRLFESYVSRWERGEDPDLEGLIHEHPEHADELRRHHEDWQRLQAGFAAEGAGRAGGTSGSWLAFLDRLRARERHEDRYRDGGEVARGGMGVIRRVYDPDTRRELAMKKQLGRADRAGGADDTDPSLGRFLDEAQLTAQLDHPGIVPVHEVGLDATGRAWFTMKLVRGADLREVFRKCWGRGGRLEPDPRRFGPSAGL